MSCHCHVTQTETRDNDTALPLVEILVTWSHDTDVSTVILSIISNKKLISNIFKLK